MELIGRSQNGRSSAKRIERPLHHGPSKCGGSKTGKIVIGWAGSITHEGDQAAIKGSLKRVLEKHPNVTFAIVSAYSIMESFIRDLDLPKDQVVSLEPTNFESYPALPAQFDIGIAPLAHNVFNLSKSDLKLKEYGARGVPYVATRIAPYNRFHQDTKGQGGYLAGSMSEWESALTTLVEDEEDRRTKGAWIQKHVLSECTYAKNAYLWADAIKEARDAARFNATATREYHVPRRVGRNDPCPCGSGVKYKKCCVTSYGR